MKALNEAAIKVLMEKVPGTKKIADLNPDAIFVHGKVIKVQSEWQNFGLYIGYNHMDSYHVDSVERE